MVRNLYVGVEFITINVMLHTKSEQKVIGNKICTPIIFCVGRVWVVILLFLLEKQT